MRIKVSEFVTETLQDLWLLQGKYRLFPRAVLANKLKQFNDILVTLFLVGDWGVLICPLALEPPPDNRDQVEGILRTDERDISGIIGWDVLM